MGAGKSTGKPASRSRSTRGAPVEPTTPTTATSLGRRGTERRITGWASTRARATCTMRRMVPTSRCKLVSSNPSAGLWKTSRAPPASASCSDGLLEPGAPTSTRIGQGHSRMMRKVASVPPMMGINRSMVTRSGRSSAAIRTACAPSLASPTISRSDSRDSPARSTVRTTGESSTTSTRMRAGAPVTIGPLPLPSPGARTTACMRATRAVRRTVAASAAAAVASNPVAGLGNTSSAPRARASIARVRTSPPSRATTTMAVGQSRMIRAVASSPSITGMSTSMVMTSGRSRSANSTAVLPSPASPTTSISGTAANASPSTARTSGESSTTSTRVFTAAPPGDSRFATAGPD